MPSAVRSARRVSTASALWTSGASAAAIAIGLAEASLALMAFGLVQLFDFVADVVLVIHFRAAATAEHLEQLVLRVVTFGLIGLGSSTGVVSVVHLRYGEGPSNSSASAALAVVSVIALTALALRKRQVAMRVPSDALRADGRLTSVGAMLAAVTVVGTSTAESLDWWWMDPVAALVIAMGAIGLAFATKG